MGMETQAKILRVLQDRRFMHLGGVQEIQVDVRILAATNVDLRRPCAKASFREDLYYRLNVITIDLPPLRSRREDIPLLATHFLKHFAEENGLTPRTLAPEAMRALMDYDWPGNVRELENVIERGVVLSPTAVIRLELLPGQLTGRTYSASLLEHDAERLALRHPGRHRAPHHHRQAGALQLEPDRGSRAVPYPALHAEPEDQAPLDRDQEAR